MSDDEDDDMGGENDPDAVDEFGLSDRYKAALAETEGERNPTGDDHSFTRYLKTSQMGL